MVPPTQYSSIAGALVSWLGMPVPESATVIGFTPELLVRYSVAA